MEFLCRVMNPLVDDVQAWEHTDGGEGQPGAEKIQRVPRFHGKATAASLIVNTLPDAKPLSEI